MTVAIGNLLCFLLVRAERVLVALAQSVSRIICSALSIVKDVFKNICSALRNRCKTYLWLRRILQRYSLVEKVAKPQRRTVLPKSARNMLGKLPRFVGRKSRKTKVSDIRASR